MSEAPDDSSPTAEDDPVAERLPLTDLEHSSASSPSRRNLAKGCSLSCRTTAPTKPEEPSRRQVITTASPLALCFFPNIGKLSPQHRERSRCGRSQQTGMLEACGREGLARSWNRSLLP